MSHTAPSPSVLGAICRSFTKLPSFRNWIRLLAGRTRTPGHRPSARRNGPGCETAAPAGRPGCSGQDCCRRELSIGAPESLDLAVVHVDHGDTVIAVAVGQECFVRSGVEGDLGHSAEAGHAAAVGRLVGYADLQQELAVVAELEEVGVDASARRAGPAVTRESEQVPFPPIQTLSLVDGDPVIGKRPDMSLRGAAPELTRLPSGSNSRTGGAARRHSGRGSVSRPASVRAVSVGNPRWTMNT